MSIYKKISRITAKGAARKTGRMTQAGKYNYHTIDDVLDYLRPLLVDEGLVVTYSTVSTENIQTTIGGSHYWNCLKTIRVTITDSETGTSISGDEIGYGHDRQDKGPGKATSYALKTFLVATFMLKGLPDEDTSAPPEARPAAKPEARPVASATPSKAGSVDDLRKACEKQSVKTSALFNWAGCEDWNSFPADKIAEAWKLLKQRADNGVAK